MDPLPAEYEAGIFLLIVYSKNKTLVSSHSLTLSNYLTLTSELLAGYYVLLQYSHYQNRISRQQL
jgi:hypothetical protein